MGLSMCERPVEVDPEQLLPQLTLCKGVGEPVVPVVPRLVPQSEHPLGGMQAGTQFGGRHEGCVFCHDSTQTHLLKKRMKINLQKLGLQTETYHLLPKYIELHFSSFS